MAQDLIGTSGGQNYYVGQSDAKTPAQIADSQPGNTYGPNNAYTPAANNSWTGGNGQTLTNDPSKGVVPISSVQNPSPVNNIGSSATPSSLGLTYTPDPNQPGIDSASKAAGIASGYLDANGNPTTKPNEGDVYSQTLSKFQDQINSLNAARAQAEANIRTTYAPIEANRVGEGTAIQSRRGLLGSDFGAAQTDTINKANANELNTAVQASDASYDDKINSLYGQAQTLSEKTYNDKLTAYTNGADATIKYLQGKTTTANNNATQIAGAAIAQGINLTDPTKQADVNALAQQLGVSPTVLLNSYRSAKAESDKAATDLAKIYADIAKTKGETLTPEQATAKASADLAATKANTSQSYASAAASLAAAAKSKAETKQITEGSNTDKVQQKLEQDYRQVLVKEVNSRSGNLGTEDAKVVQANHLSSLLNQYYDPKTGQYNVPKAQYGELVLGLAGMLSKTGTPTESQTDNINTATAKGDLNKAITYVTGTPTNGTTQQVIKNLADSISRQAKTAISNRTYAVKLLQGLAPTDLEQARKDALEKNTLSPYSGIKGIDSESTTPTGSTFNGIKLPN